MVREARNNAYQVRAGQAHQCAVPYVATEVLFEVKDDGVGQREHERPWDQQLDTGLSGWAAP